jgi:cold shock CspA family protein
MPEVGIVKFFNARLGYGFIKPASGVHSSQCASTIVEDQHVEYDLGTGRDGRPMAINVHALDSKDPDARQP